MSSEAANETMEGPVAKKARTEEDPCKQNNSEGEAQTNNAAADLPPPGAGPNLRKCIATWGLLPPYENVDNDQAWGAYYQERSLLDFRHTDYWDADGEDFKKLPRCYKSNLICSFPPVENLCRDAETKISEDGVKLCGHCGKAREYVTNVPSSVRAKWSQKALVDNALPQKLPKMTPHCRESYAKDCHYSGTTKGQYEDYLETIQRRIERTLSSTRLEDSDKVAEIASNGVYILNYWVNFEDSAPNAMARTVDVSTRLYSPFGTGGSIDVSWYRHYRERFSIDNESTSTLYGQTRSLEDCDPKAPTSTFDHRKPYEDENVICLADADGGVCSQGQLKTLVSTVFGQDVSEKLSARKIFGLLARASGAYHIGKAGPWVYDGMREHLRLDEGETSEGEETSGWSGWSGEY